MLVGNIVVPSTVKEILLTEDDMWSTHLDIGGTRLYVDITKEYVHVFSAKDITTHSGKMLYGKRFQFESEKFVDVKFPLYVFFETDDGEPCYIKIDDGDSRLLVTPAQFMRARADNASHGDLTAADYLEAHEDVNKLFILDVAATVEFHVESTGFDIVGVNRAIYVRGDITEIALHFKTEEKDALRDRILALSSDVAIKDFWVCGGTEEYINGYETWNLPMEDGVNLKVVWSHKLPPDTIEWGNCTVAVETSEKKSYSLACSTT